MVNTFRFFIILAFILFFSCSTKNEGNKVYTDSLLPIEKDTIKATDSTITKNSNSSRIKEDSSISDSIPKPVKLPFNAH